MESKHIIKFLDGLVKKNITVVSLIMKLLMIIIIVYYNWLYIVYNNSSSRVWHITKFN